MPCIRSVLRVWHSFSHRVTRRRRPRGASPKSELPVTFVDIWVMDGAASPPSFLPPSLLLLHHLLPHHLLLLLLTKASVTDFGRDCAHLETKIHPSSIYQFSFFPPLSLSEHTHNKKTNKKKKRVDEVKRKKYCPQQSSIIQGLESVNPGRVGSGGAEEEDHWGRQQHHHHHQRFWFGTHDGGGAGVL